MNPDSAPVTPIPPGRLDEAAEVLQLAFADYPLMRYFLANSGAAYEGHLRAMLRFACLTRLAVGDPLLGVVHDGRLRAVAAVTGPERRPWPRDLLESFQTLQETIGPQAAALADEFAELNASHRSAEPHYHLGVIGVPPEAQGQGLGQSLLAAVRDLALAHPAAECVDLETVNPANVLIYRRAGYQVTATARFGPLDVWYMVQPIKAPSATSRPDR